MMRTIVDVVRGEGLVSALRRAGERLDEAAHHVAGRARAPFAGEVPADVVNVAWPSAAPRTGGVAVQLQARLRAERAMREVALLSRGVLELRTHVRRVSNDFETAAREALAVTGARALHIEGTSGVPLDALLRIMDSGVPVVVSVHDFALFCERPNLLEEPAGAFCFYSRDAARCVRCSGSDQMQRRALAVEMLRRASGVIFPSQFLLEQHRELFALAHAEVIEPAVPGAIARVDDDRPHVAFAGNVRRHKGGHLLAEIAQQVRALHVFGGGDPELLRALRRMPNVVVHGYYRAGALPSLLARHRIGLVVLPSLFAESYSIVMSQAWLAGAFVAAFDFGAPAERIRRDGGGWLAPLASGAAGLIEIIERWTPQRLPPRVVPSPSDAARAHVHFYRARGMLQGSAGVRAG